MGSDWHFVKIETKWDISESSGPKCFSVKLLLQGGCTGNDIKGVSSCGLRLGLENSTLQGLMNES